MQPSSAHIFSQQPSKKKQVLKIYLVDTCSAAVSRFCSAMFGQTPSTLSFESPSQMEHADDLHWMVLSFFSSRAHPSVLDVDAVNAPWNDDLPSFSGCMQCLHISMVHGQRLCLTAANRPKYHWAAKILLKQRSQGKPDSLPPLNEPVAK